MNRPSTERAAGSAPFRTAFPPRYKWELLLWFWLAYFFNQGDRQVFNAVLPLIKTDLRASDIQFGLIAGGFTLAYGVLVPLAGFLSDRWRPKWIVVGSLLGFSSGTLLTGASGGLLTLLLFRSVATGAGEAFYYPAANALIGRHHHATRAQAMAIHQSALYVGTIVSSVAAAAIGEWLGWRAAFAGFGICGLIVAGSMALRLRDEPAEAAASAEPGATLKESLASFVRRPTTCLLSLAFGATVFVNIAFMTWMPTFLLEKFGLRLREAAFQSVFIHLLCALAGVLLGGRISDRLAERRRVIRLEMGWSGLLLGVPCLLLLGRAGTMGLVLVALAGFGLCRGLYDSNLFAALFEVVPEGQRATATGLMVAFAFAIGASGPVALGGIKQHAGLGAGFSLLAVIYLFAAAVLWAASRWTFSRDCIPPLQPLAALDFHGN